jgi:hypothetical protein
MHSIETAFFLQQAARGGWLPIEVKEDRQPEDTGCLVEEIVKIRTSLYC